MSDRVFGHWQIDESVHPMDDSLSIFAGTPAIEGKNEYGGTPTLLIRYVEGKIEILVNWAYSFYCDDNKCRVKWRARPLEPVIETWNTSTNHEATFSPNPQSLYETMKKADLRFIIQNLHESIMAVFSYDGIEEVFKKIDSIQLKESQDKIKSAQDKVNYSNTSPIAWADPLRNTIDSFDSHIVVASELTFEIELFNNLTVTLANEPNNDRLKAEYFSLYTKIVSKYNDHISTHKTV